MLKSAAAAIPVLLCLASLYGCINRIERSPGDPRPVPVCRIVLKPEAYLDHPITVTGDMAFGASGVIMLGDKACRPFYIAVVFPEGVSGDSAADLVARFSLDLPYITEFAGNHRARASLVGRVKQFEAERNEFYFRVDHVSGFEARPPRR